MKIGFIPKRADNGSITHSSAAILRCHPELRALGIQLHLDQEKNVDLLCVHKQHLQADRGHLLGGSIPLVIDETRDSARVAPEVRKWANKYPCCGILKSHIYRPRWIYTEGIQFDHDLIELGPGYACFERLDVLKQNEPDWNRERPIDVHFAGTMKYSKDGKETPQAKHVRRHRERCADAVEALADHGLNVVVHRGRDLTLQEYWDELRSSKICVSPYGWAETCHRDVEAILCGCVLMKPPCHHIATFPNVYSRYYTDELIREDFSDAKCCVDIAFMTLETCTEWMNDRFNNIVEDSTQDKVAEQMHDVFTRCLARAK